MSTRTQIILVSVIALMAALGFMATKLVFLTSSKSFVTASFVAASSTEPSDLRMINAIRSIDRFPLRDGSELVFVNRGLKDSDGNFPYELWRVSDGGFANLILASAPNGWCSSENATTTEDGLVKLSLNDSPCEAGYERRSLYFSLKDGQKVLESDYNSFSGATSFEEGASPRGKMNLHLLFKGDCKGVRFNSNGIQTSPTPEVILTGVQLMETESSEGKDVNYTFPLPHPKKVTCEQTYGGGIAMPVPSAPPEYVDGKVSLSLPDHRFMIIDLSKDSNNGAFVSFE